MKNTSQSGYVITSLVVKIALAVALFLGGVFVSKKISDNSPSKNEAALSVEKSSVAKSGQQLAAATTKEVSLAKDQSDPAIVAARKTSARADVALAAGLGSLTPEQAQWVQNLVEADAAGFTSALSAKDSQISESGNKIAALEKKVADETQHSGFLEKLLIAGAVVVVFVLYVLPWLEKLFPPLAAFIGEIQSVVNPFLESLKAKAQADIASAKAETTKLYGELGSAVKDMRDAGATGAVQHLTNNLSAPAIQAVSAAAVTAAANDAAAKAAAAAQVAIAA